MKSIKIVLLLLLISSQSYTQDIDKETALGLIKANAALFLNANKNEQTPLVTNAYKDQQTGLTFIYFQQQYQGIKVFNQIQSATFNNNKLLYKSGTFIGNIAAKVPTTTATITAADAIKKAAFDLQLSMPVNIEELENSFTSNKKIVFSNCNISKRKIKTELVFKTNNTNNKLNLVWCVSIAPIGTQDNWNVKVDALTGDVLEKTNETIYENEAINNDDHSSHKACRANVLSNTQLNFLPPPPTTVNATYNVVKFPNENRFIAGVAAETNPWLKAGVGNNATTNGWHFDGINNYVTTRGNNVFAYEDSLDIDAPGRVAISTTNAPNLNFNFTPDFTKQPTTTANRNFATTNLFYWNNIVHDISYQYGFTEAAGNFQANNIGRGGFGNDMVMAEAQDGGGLNNANFWSNPDGDTARMQMYLFSHSLGFTVLTPATIGGKYQSREGAISTNNLLKNVGTKTGQLVLYNDDAIGTTHNACGVASNNLIGKIALIEYSYIANCTYANRVKNAQNAGAIAVIVIGQSVRPSTMTGTDNSITIPAMMIGAYDGDIIINQLNFGNIVTVKLEDGVHFDGDIDNGIIVHEYAHGISTRLTGGAATSGCLFNAEQAGEGWSDYLALMMTTNWGTATQNDGIVPRKMGVYAFNQNPNGGGIRTYPYSTDITINPSTYNDLTSNGQVHYIGSVWCNALWEMTWGIIKQENNITPNLYDATATGGNVVALNLVMLGLKLQPCSPGFLDSRDAILAADDILYNGKHKCTIWAAFAKRGMGYSANQGSSSSTFDQVVAFDVPMVVTLSNKTSYKTMPLTTNATFDVKATCQCKSPTNNYKIKAIIPAGLSYSGSSGGIANGDSVIFSNINFSKPFQTDSLHLNLTASFGGCALDSVINDNRDTKTIGGFTSSNITGTNNWLATTGLAYSPTKSWQIDDIETISESALTSTTFVPTNISLLSFWHQYQFEPGYDGGLIETSVNGGSWQNVTSKILQNGYTASFGASAALPNEQVYSGENNTFINTVVDLSKLSGQNTKIRFRVGTDETNGDFGLLAGWAVDDITVTNGCGGFLKFYLYDSANNLMDSSFVPIFITPAVLPVKYSSFIAKAFGKKSMLNWGVAEETNVKKYIVERSSNTIDFNKIGEVFAVNKNGSEYFFTDESPLLENYYRIKAVDFNGAVNFSSIQKVSFKNTKENSLVLIPNPSSENCKVYLPSHFKATQIKVYDAMGKMVLSQVSNNRNNTYFNLNTTFLKQGTYSVNVYDEVGSILTEKLVVIK